MKRIGTIGGLGVGAGIFYYKKLTAGRVHVDAILKCAFKTSF